MISSMFHIPSQLLLREVLEEMPLALRNMESPLFTAIIPDGPLGSDDKDFSNVSWGYVMGNGQTGEDISVGVFATGKLGGLQGGLLHLADLRKALSGEDVMELGQSDVQSQVSKKRTGLTTYIEHYRRLQQRQEVTNTCFSPFTRDETTNME